MKTQIDNIEARLDERCEHGARTESLIEVPGSPQSQMAMFADQLTRIEAALTRLDAGDYGYCDQCRKAIEIDRLEVDPATTQCGACAKAPSAGS